MERYLQMARTIIEKGYDTGDRTGVGTRALPGYFYSNPMWMDDDGYVHDYPLLTTKKVFLRGTFEELMWKLRGETNITSLVSKNVHIWTEWPFKKWLEETDELNKFEWYINEDKSDYTDEWKQRIKDFESRLLLDEGFSKKWGELGPTYGHHMRDFGSLDCPFCFSRIPGEDQLLSVIDSIRNKPEDRRIIMSLWNPHDNKNTLLPPCPCFYQFFANQEGMLHVNVYQRSCDTFLGVPFNDSQDALLLILLAKVTGRKPGIFNHTFGDVHIYNNHRKQIELQLTRTPRSLPSIKVNRDTDNIFDFKFEDIDLVDYDPWPTIKAPVAV